MPYEINTLPLTTSTPGYIRIQDQGTNNLAGVNGWNTGDALGNQMALQVLAASMLFNGVSGWDRTREASAVNLIAQSGIGAALVTPPGQWYTTSLPATSALATATRAAGGAGIRHVYMACSLAAAAGGTAPTTGVSLQGLVRDSASGGAPTIDTAILGVQAVSGSSAPTFFPSQRSVAGSIATAMTAELNAAITNVTQGATLMGYDAS